MNTRINVLNVRERMTGTARRWAIWYQLAVVFTVIACIMSASIMAQRFVLGQTLPGLYLLCVFLLFIPALFGAWRVSVWALPIVCVLFIAYEAEPWLFHAIQPKVSRKEIIKLLVLIVGSVSCLKLQAGIKVLKTHSNTKQERAK